MSAAPPPFERLFDDVPPPPAWWASRVEQIDRAVDAAAAHANVLELAVTPGDRLVRAVVFGEAEPGCLGPANFNSAVAARDPSAYVNRQARRRPVLVLLAGVHGQEVEGMVAACSALAIMGGGMDLRGRPQDELADRLRRLRLIVIPCANPDGRARVPYDGWCGLPSYEMHRVGQGTRRDGSQYGWPGCKAVHPMVGDVGGLGGYFDDAGVNLAHDEFFAPMSPVTAALLRLTAAEAPELLLNLHGYESPPGILAVNYVPRATKQAVADFAARVYRHFEKAGIPHNRIPAVADDTIGPERFSAFNMNSALYHAGAALAMTFESPHGLTNGAEPFNYEQILDLHHVLFLTAADALLEGR